MYPWYILHIHFSVSLPFSFFKFAFTCKNRSSELPGVHGMTVVVHLEDVQQVFSIKIFIFGVRDGVRLGLLPIRLSFQQVSAL